MYQLAVRHYFSINKKNKTYSLYYLLSVISLSSVNKHYLFWRDTDATRGKIKTL